MDFPWKQFCVVIHYTDTENLVQLVNYYLKLVQKKCNKCQALLYDVFEKWSPKCVLEQCEFPLEHFFIMYLKSASQEFVICYLNNVNSNFYSKFVLC